MNKLTYTPATLIDHGAMVVRTQGDCTCHNEDTTFKPHTEEEGLEG
jgi:hypothetical protein